MESIGRIDWVIAAPFLTPAVEYTVRLLSTLMGRHAHIAGAPLQAEPTAPYIYYGEVMPATAGAALWIVPDTAFWESVGSGREIAPRKKSVWSNTVVPGWRQNNSMEHESPEAVGICPVDPIAATFFLVSRIEEWRSKSHDSHGRFPAENAWMVRECLIERPLVHEYAMALSSAVGLMPANRDSGIKWGENHRFAIAFTHDVDRMRMHGPLWQDLRRAAGALRFPGGMHSALRRLRSRVRVRYGKHPDPYDTLDLLSSRHEDYGFSASFLWINAPQSVRNADYTPREPDVRRRLRTLRDRGFEIGLHGSYHSFDQANILRAERDGLSSASGSDIVTIRQHYLRFHPAVTWPAQVAAGLTADTSLGFAARPGFRAGVAIPFRPWDFNSDRPFDIWEVPLAVMDGTLREYLRLTPEAAQEKSQRIIRGIAEVGGAAALLWHNSSLDDVDWPGWEAVYRSWLDETRQNDGWGTSVSAIVSAWKSHVHRLDNC